MSEDVQEGALLNMIPYKKIKLSRYQKGDYGWEISISGNDMNAIVLELIDTDTGLVKRYGARVEP